VVFGGGAESRCHPPFCGDLNSTVQRPTKSRQGPLHGHGRPTIQVLSVETLDLWVQLVIKVLFGKPVDAVIIKPKKPKQMQLEEGLQFLGHS